MSEDVLIKSLIFDLDGTLADTIGAIRHALNLTMKNYGFPVHDYETVKRMVGHGAKNLVRSACPEGTFDGNESFFDEVYQNYCDMYEQNHLETRECYDGMFEAVTELHNRGYKIAVLSNKQDPFVQGIVSQLFPSGIISVIQGQTDLPIKPDPTVPLMIAKRLASLPEECAFIGDSDVDVQTAKNAGMCSVAVTWGYRDAECLAKCCPDITVNEPYELKKYFN